MLLCADVGSADADLASGAITCPSCGGRLGPWGQGRERASGCTTAIAPWSGRPGAGAGPAGQLTCCCRPGWPRAAPTAPG